jgi:uncharacterized membrane protein YecN with MAPEG domain
MAVTAIPTSLATAGILGVIYVVLSLLVVRQRGKTRTMIGQGDSQALMLAIRAHGNFAEYVPIGLILLAGIEAAGTAHWFVLTLAGMLILGRLMHPFGLYLKAPNVPRALGAMLTFLMILAASIKALLIAL